MRKLTESEVALLSRASKVLPTPLQPDTNITALSYIMAGKTKELEELIRATQEE